MESSSSGSPEAQQGAPASGPRPAVEYVGFWKRLVAALIDLMVLLVIIVPIEVAIFGTNYVERAMAGETMAVDFWVQFALPLVAVLLFWRYGKGTPGLMAIGARIVDVRTGAPPTTGKLLLRALVLAVLLVLSPFLIGLIGLVWMVFDGRKQGLHDKAAGTAVVYDD